MTSPAPVRAAANDAAAAYQRLRSHLAYLKLPAAAEALPGILDAALTALEASRLYPKSARPNGGLSSEPLWQGLEAAFANLKDEMLRRGTAAWFGSADGGFVCEMPFSWRACPDGIIGAASPVPLLRPCSCPSGHTSSVMP